MDSLFMVATGLAIPLYEYRSVFFIPVNKLDREWLLQKLRSGFARLPTPSTIH